MFDKNFKDMLGLGMFSSGVKCNHMCNFCMRDNCSERDKEYLITKEDMDYQIKQLESKYKEMVNSDGYKKMMEVIERHSGDGDFSFNEEELDEIDSIREMFDISDIISMILFPLLMNLKNKKI